MPQLVWDKVGQRTYESGLDRGVLYRTDTGEVFPWNGLTSVVEKLTRSSSDNFFDGAKISESVTIGSFAATVSAITYPDVVVELEGTTPLRNGVFLGQQHPGMFAMSYRTKVGNDVDGDTSHYKIHVIYNVMLKPSDRTYASANDDPSLVEFEWELTTVPVKIDGYLAAAHITIDTKKVDSKLLKKIERYLYGDGAADASLIPMNDLVQMLLEWFIIKITDNGDGTWMAETDYDGYIIPLVDQMFEINHANVIFIDDDTYQISDTKDITDSATIKIVDNGDGTWTATTSSPDLIYVDEDGSFELYNATVEVIDADSYTLSDTPD